MQDFGQAVATTAGTDAETLDAVITRHRKVSDLIDETFITLQKCYDEEKHQFPPAINRGIPSPPTPRDTAIVLLAIERSAQTLMNRIHLRKGFRYADYKSNVFRPVMDEIERLALTPDEVLQAKARLGERVAPFSRREVFTCSLILELMAIESTPKTSDVIFIESISCLLDSLTRPYAPHYVLGGASIMGTEPSAFVTFHALRGLMSVVDILENSARQHESLAKLTEEIEAWQNDPLSREKTVFSDPREFQKHIAVQLEQMPKGLGLWNVTKALREAFPKIDGGTASDLKKWGAAFTLHMGKASEWLKSFAQSAHAESRKPPAYPEGPQRPGRKESETRSDSEPSSKEYRRLAGATWKSVFFRDMVRVLNEVEEKYSKLNGDISLEKLREQLTESGKTWSRAREATHEYVKKFAKWATLQLHLQLALSTITHKTNFDPSEIPFLLWIYNELVPEKNPRLIDKGLEVLFQMQQPDGRWPVGAPFWFDPEKQIAVYVANIEIITAAMVLIKERGLEGYYKQLDQVFNWVATNRRRVAKAPKQGKEDKENILQGWSTDMIFERERIDVWMTARVLEFLVEYEALLQEYITRKTLEGRYDYRPPSKHTPLWNDVLEPVLETSQKDQRFKDKIFDEYIETFRNEGRSSKNAMILYGPPGTSKTTFAKAIAQELGWTLVTITPSDFVKEGIDKSESMARTLFRDLRRLRNVVVLFDEIDEMLRSRDTTEAPEGIAMLRFIVPGMLPKLQELKQHGETGRLMIIIATNYRDRLDAAVRRKGRVDDEFAVLPPDRESRRLHLYQFLGKKSELDGTPFDPVIAMKQAGLLADITPGWVYAELTQLVDAVNLENLKVYKLRNPKGGSRETHIENMSKRELVSVRALNPSRFYRGRKAEAKNEARKVFEICYPARKPTPRSPHTKSIMTAEEAAQAKKSPGSTPRRAAPPEKVG